jgi:hypothetical protein
MLQALVGGEQIITLEERVTGPEFFHIVKILDLGAKCRSHREYATARAAEHT